MIKRATLLMMILVLLPAISYAQFGNGIARRIQSGTALPSTCAVSSIFFLTTGSVGQYNCNTANTWTAVGSGGGGGAPSGPAGGSLTGTYPNPITVNDFDFTTATAYYTMQEGSGSTLIDHSGHSNNATQAGTVTWTADGGNSFASSAGNYWALPTAVSTGSGLRTMILAMNYAQSNLNGTTGTCAYQSALGPIASSLTTAILIGFDVSSNFTCLLAPTVYTSGSGGGTMIPDEMPGYGIHVIAFVMDPSVINNNHIYIDGVETDYFSRAVTAITAAQLALGANPAISNGFSGKIYSAAFLTSQLTASQIQQATYTMTHALQSRGVVLQPAVADTNGYLLHLGDSLTVGYGGAGTTIVSAESLTDTSLVRVNGGTGGKTLLEMQRAMYGFAIQRTSLGQRRIAVIWGGTNDLCQGTGDGHGATAAQAWQRYAGISQSLQQAGYQTVISTMIDRGGGTGTACQILKAAFNTLIRANWKFVAIALADPASDPNLGPDNASANTTYFSGDEIHLTATGYTLAATYFASAINGLTVSTVTASNCLSSASPAACGSASAGSIAIAATATTLVVNTSLVTSSSQIQLTFDSSLGTRLGVTCNTISPTGIGVSSRSPGVSFTVSASASITNPACLSYTLVN